MRTDFPYLSRFVSKLLEILGAGFASAVGAFLLGHIATPVTPAPVVQIMPADADTIRMVRGESKRVDEVRQDVAGQSKSVVTAAEKVANPTRASAGAERALSVRKEHKSELVRVIAGSQDMGGQHTLREQPLEIAPAAETTQRIWPQSEAAEATTASVPEAQAPVEEHFRLLAALRQIPAWFLTSPTKALAIIPRPPLPVRQFWESTM